MPTQKLQTGHRTFVFSPEAPSTDEESRRRVGIHIPPGLVLADGREIPKSDGLFTLVSALEDPFRLNVAGRSFVTNSYDKGIMVPHEHAGEAYIEGEQKGRTYHYVTTVTHTTFKGIYDTLPTGLTRDLSASEIIDQVLQGPREFESSTVTPLYQSSRRWIEVLHDHPDDLVADGALTFLTEQSMRLLIYGVINLLRPNSGRDPKPQAISRLTIERIKHADEYLEANPAASVTLTSLCQMCALSPRHLQLAFQSVFQASPMQRFRRHKLEFAKTLLVKGNDSVQEIAEQCGFQTAETFAQFFTRELGISPKRFQESSQRD